MIGLLLLPALAAGQPVKVVDLATTSDEVHLFRGLGSVGLGNQGVPVAGGFDVDGDGFLDSAFAAMKASPSGRSQAGTVHLLFGDGTTTGTLDTSQPQPRLLQIHGDQSREHLGSEIWMDDVTGDGVGDLLLCRQDFTPGTRVGAGAVTVLVGGPALRTLAATSGEIDLRSPPPGVELFTLWGRYSGGRLGIWLRTGDLDGDGIADLVIGADQEALGGFPHAGSLYAVRGGSHLAVNATADLADLGQAGFLLDGHVLNVAAPFSSHGHFGATVAVADLDADGRGEILASKALSRSGATLQPSGGNSSHGIGGTTFGTLYIHWSSAVPAAPEPWPTALQLIQPGTSSATVLDGAGGNRKFGEEILGGLDYDGDGRADLFVGDITGNGPNGSFSGLGHIVFDARRLRGLSTNRASLPSSIRVTDIYGPSPGAIAGDTAAHGDVDGDGLADLMVGSPHDSPLGRSNAGALHVLLGQGGAWPEVVDLANLPSQEVLEVVEIYGALGDAPGDAGDTLCYSAATGDYDADGRVDLVVNEMVGNGSAVDTGNLLILSGQLLSASEFYDGFEIGSTAAWSSTSP
ncbi:MAG: FG-GAP repeat protein [Acidobacteriota bacterium]